MLENNEDKEQDITAGQKMISAMSGSFFSSLLVTPFDVVRVRLQSQPQSISTTTNCASAQGFTSNSTFPNIRLTSCCREVFFADNNTEYCLASQKGPELSHSVQKANCVFETIQKNSYNSTFDSLRKIARQEGFTTLWRGLAPTLVMGIPANIIYFTGYDWLRFDRKSPIKNIFSDNWAPLMAGSSARIVAGTVVSPIEMLRTRMQATRSVGGNHFVITLRGISKTISDHGYSSLWRGLTLTLWRDVPFSGFYWWGYETLKGNLIKLRYERRLVSESVERLSPQLKPFQIQGHNSTEFMDSFISGSISGAIASFLTMPFDVGKTRRQVYVGSIKSQNEVKLLAPEERSMPRFLLHILQEEGITGLWRGCIPRTLKVAPACAIMISFYEVGKQTFRSLNEVSGTRKAF